MPGKENVDFRTVMPPGFPERLPAGARPVVDRPLMPPSPHPPGILSRAGRQGGLHGRPWAAPFPRIIGNDPRMKAIFQQILDVAPYDYPVHLSGDTGTGKELAARAIHDHSGRKKGPFIPVNCGAIPEHLVESELFGHVKGAFSGAGKARKGRFELAHGGTLFLDEVTDLSPFIQVRLLRVLENGSFEKVGGEQTVCARVRLISAANRPLKTEMKAGRFRQDLYYRINVVPIHMPPLKSRNGDIGLLARHFLNLAASRYHRHPVMFSDAAMAVMRRYDWPGNVRELQNAVHFSFVRSGGSRIDACHLPPEIQRAAAVAVGSGKLNPASVAEAIRRCGGNKSKAARHLGVGRATLYRFLSSCAEIRPTP